MKEITDQLNVILRTVEARTGCTVPEEKKEEWGRRAVETFARILVVSSPAEQALFWIGQWKAMGLQVQKIPPGFEQLATPALIESLKGSFLVVAGYLEALVEGNLPPPGNRIEDRIDAAIEAEFSDLESYFDQLLKEQTNA